MKKNLLLIGLAVLSLGLLTACGAKPAAQAASETAQTAADETRVYESEKGPVTVPASPKRIVVLDAFVSGHVMALGAPIVGIDTYSKTNPNYAPYLKDAQEVSEENIEQILALEPDLIIASESVKALDKLQSIAPTIVYTYGKLPYLDQYAEVGKLLGKEAEAKEWIMQFKKSAAEIGEKIKAKNGADATYSVIESYSKQLYVFGDNWGRGTQILYQEMGLKMPETVKQMTDKDGYYAISPEVIKDYMGDYVIFSKNAEADNTFQATETYKSIPAVKNNRVYEADAKAFYFIDPITLDYQLQFIEEKFLGGK